MNQTMITLARDSVAYLTNQVKRQTDLVDTMAVDLDIERRRLDKLNQELAEVNTFLAENDPAGGVTHAENS